MAGTTSGHHSSGDTAARAAREAAAGTITGPSERRDVLSTPVERNADLAVAHAELEEARKKLAERAQSVGAEKRRLEAMVREYNAAHTAAPWVVQPAVLEELRVSGRAVGRELAGTERPEASGLGPQPAYSSADRNLKAATQIAGELEALEGDELRERTRRMRDLLAAASR